MARDLPQLRLLALLVLLHGAAHADDTTEVIGAVGGSVTFRIPNQSGNATFWSFRDDPIATVALKDPPGPIFSEEKYKKRFSFSESGRALSISQLSLEDAGPYSVKIDGKKSTFTLRVYSELAEPRVTCEAQNCSGGSCRFSLRCSAPGAGLGNVSFSWSRGAEPWDEGPSVLLGNESSWSEPWPLTCTARNPVSSRNVTVVAPGGLCAGGRSGSQAGLGVAAGLGAVGLVSVLLFVLLCKCKGWRKSLLSQEKAADPVTTSDCMTVYAEVGPSQPRFPNGIPANPAGAPESSRTAYSLVQRPGQVDGGKEENATVSVLKLA